MVEATTEKVERFVKGNKVPLPGLLPTPNSRVFDNSN